MALQGTIRDFGLADIFQLIGIQRKTGVLTLTNDSDTVTVKFVEGQVAGADTQSQRLEDQLGRVLVRTGQITDAQLREALQTQKNTLQRLGYILVNTNAITAEDLRDALQVQVSQIIYRLFRWRDARYHFEPKEEIDYYREHFTPISAETILMEGARMIDEWPIIERRVRSATMVFRKTDAGAAIEAPVESLVDEDVEFDFGFEGTDAGTDAGADEQEIRLSPEEREVLRMVDGRSRVSDLVDRSPLGEFDVYRSLYELLTRHLIEEVVQRTTTAARREGRATTRLLVRGVAVVLLGFAFAAVLTLDANPVTPWRVAGSSDATGRLRGYASRVRMERIEDAIRVFYLDNGTVPDRLVLLTDHGYLDPRDLRDPWGRDYRYELRPGSYRLVGLDAQGEPSRDLVVSRTFSASERMMLEGAVEGR